MAIRGATDCARAQSALSPNTGVRRGRKHVKQAGPASAFNFL